MGDPRLSAEELFGEALDLPQEHRSAFLDEACRDATELRRLIEELLRENQRYSTNTMTWRVLKQFQDPVGFTTWSRDSTSLYMVMVEGNNGLYRLTVPDGRWEKLSELAGTYTGIGGGAPGVSLTADGQPAMMANTSVAQIYSLHWKY